MKTKALSIQDFLDLLPIVADKPWTLTPGLQLIRVGKVCPLCALVNEITGKDEWHYLASTAFASLGIYSQHIVTLVAAADDPKHSLRPALMQALEMKL